MRSRFAPSPTGDLHIGGARTALFAYLWAKKVNGEFKLRIEDTDVVRSTKESVTAIIDGMKWLGLDYDGDIVFQTTRLTRYIEVIDKLLANNKAYYCNCSTQRLDNLRQKLKDQGKKPKYDGYCRNKNLTSGVVRFKNPSFGTVVFIDEVKGKIVIDNAELDDLIIKRSNGTPTYNLAVVVDDFDMNIDIVIRGDDHINNTPRQINLYQALDWKVPKFAHLPMILDNNGARLSKRDGVQNIMSYQVAGFLPQAIINYLARLGWSHGNQEIFSLSEMINLFDLKNINKAPASFDNEKLLWLNQQYIKTLSAQKIYQHLKWHLNNRNIKENDNILQVIDLLKQRSKTLIEMADSCKMFYGEITSFNKELAIKQFSNSKLILQFLIDNLNNLITWNAEEIKNIINKTCDKFEIGFGKVGQPFRLALSGDGNAGSIDKTAELVGKKETLKRLEFAIDFINKNN